MPPSGEIASPFGPDSAVPSTSDQTPAGDHSSTLPVGFPSNSSVVQSLFEASKNFVTAMPPSGSATTLFSTAFAGATTQPVQVNTGSSALFAVTLNTSTDFAAAMVDGEQF